MFQKKVLQYRGSKERLRKMVQQRGGEFLENQRFKLPWQSSQYKEFHRLTFQIRCRYKKKEDGYEITYAVVPTLLSFLRIIAPWLLWCYAILEIWGIQNWKEGSFLIVFGVFYTASQLWQLIDSQRGFVSRFTTETW